jgi:hypothetical protein
MATEENGFRTGSSGRNSPRYWISVTGIVLAVGVFVWQLPFFLGGATPWPQYAHAFRDVLFHQLWGLGVLLVLTALTRTIALRSVLAFWLLGVFAVYGLLVALGTAFIPIIGVTEVGIRVAPVVQTFVEALVVLSFYVVRSRSVPAWGSTRT